mmetsp:Transcript_6257/g.25260  ORF Transcript_6257/g.25260 Transcript_6257/m.25260 type:complete len:211 (+) Transcript_6257:33-665(+)
MGCLNSTPEEQYKRQQPRRAPSMSQGGGQMNRSSQQQQQQQRQRQQRPGDRRQQQLKGSPASGGRAESRPSPISASVAKDEILLGTSYSERREMENDAFFRRLIDRTNEEFIDVSQNTVPLDGADAVHRTKDYLRIVDELDMPTTTNGVFDLGKGTLGHEEVQSILDKTAVTPHDITFMRKCGDDLSSALRNMAVKDKGALVVPFPSVSM